MNTLNGSILIVDGNDSDRRELGNLLRSAGFDVIETATLDESSKHIEQRRPEVMIIDTTAVDTSTIGAYDRIRSNPHMTSVTVLERSSSSDELDAEDRSPLNADGYLDRSMTPRALLETIQAYLRMGRAEKAVRVAADQLQTTFNAITDGLALLDPEGSVVQCNGALARMFGRPIDDILGIPYHELLGIPLREIQQSPFLRMLRSRRQETADLHHDKRPIHVTVDPVFAADDELRGAVCVVTDTSSVSDVEQKLAQRFEQIKTVYNLSHAVVHAEALQQIYAEALDSINKTLGTPRASILLLDPDGVMRFKAWRGISESYRRTTEGHSPWSPETQNPQPIVVPDVRTDESMADLREAILAEGIQALGFIPLTYQDRLLGKFMLYYDTPHFFSSDEIHVARTIASHIALAIERKRTEEEIRLSEERLRLALDAASMGNWNWDLRTDTIVWSESLERMHEARLDPDKGIESYLATIHPGDRGEVAERIRESLHNGGSYEVQYRLNRSDGSLRWIEGKGRVFLDENGERVRLAAVCTDITSRKRIDTMRNTEYEITRILAESETLAAASKGIIEVLCGGTNWTVGSIWGIDTSTNLLHHVETWSDDSVDREAFIEFNNTFSFPTGIDLPGRVWRDRTTAWLTSLQEDENFQRGKFIHDAGLRSGFGFPITLGDEVLGVIECFSCMQRQPDEELLKMMATIGSQIGQFIERKRAEAELRNSHSQLEIILRGVADGITAQDGGGRPIFANEAAARMIGFETPEQFLEAPLDTILDQFELIDEFGHPLPLDQLPGRQAARTGKRTERIVRFRRKESDREEWTVIKSSPILDEKGEVGYIINIFNNITERVYNAEELRISEARYRTLIEQSPLSIQIFTPDGFCINANRSWEELWGISRDALEGYNILRDRQIIDKGLMPYVHRAFDGESVAIPPMLYDPTEFNRNGRPRWVRAFLYAVRNDAGSTREVVLKLEDVTERIEAEDALFVTNQTLTALIDASPLAIAVLDPIGMVKLWNHAAERIFGWSADDVLGHPMPGVPGDRQEEFHAFNLRTLNNEIVTGAETVRRRRNDELIDVAIWTAPLRDPNGNPYAVMTVLADITDRRQAEMERMELLAKEQATRREAEIARQRFAFLAEASELLGSTLDFEKTLTRITELAVPHIADWCSVDMVTESGSTEQLAVAHVDPMKAAWARELRKANPIDPHESTGMANVIRTGRSEFYPNITDEMLVAAAKTPEHLALMREIGFTSAMIVPIVARGRTHGAISFVTAESGKLFDSTDLTLAEDLARRAAIAIDNALLIDSAQRERAKAQESEERYRDLVNGVDAIVWEGDPHTRRYTFVSHRAEHILGYPVLDWTERPDFWSDIIHPDDRNETIRRFQEAAEKGRQITFEFRAIAADGSVVWLQDIIYVTKDSEGRAQQLRGLMVDITERKRTEEALRESEERFRTMADSAPVLLWIADETNRGIYFNRGWIEFTGKEMNQQIGEGWIEGVHPDDRSRVVRERTGALERRNEFRMEFRLRRTDGMFRWVLDHAVPRFTPDGSFVGYIGSCIDITERKEMEKELEQRVHERTSELEAANKELESFSYSVSHDLRAPLRSIDGFSKALLEDYAETLDETGQDYLRRVRTASQRMGQLIDDMLNLSRVTRSEMIREKVNLSQMARQIIAELRNQEPNRDIVVDIAPNVSANGDVRLLHVVMENLLGNAWKFTSNTNAAKIEFGVRNESGHDVFFVRDNGAGFDMEYANKLFVPFQRLHTIDQFQGTGVGLATVQRIIKRHGGTIWTQATLNEGATFFFTL